MIAGILIATDFQALKAHESHLVPYDVFSTLDVIIEKFKSISCHPIITILGEESELICQQTNVDSFQCYANPDPQANTISSLKMAVNALPNDTIGFILAFAEYPYVRNDTYQIIYDTAINHPDKIIIPKFHEQRGHPVYLGKPFFEQLIQADNRYNVSLMFQAHQPVVKYVNVDDEGILLDNDDHQAPDQTWH
ncbi:MAG: NTP transferase domain-containing protein [Caldithrix sp.]|nr:NTP transferase domain-containing protein [Caldithrix sp.]